MERNPKALFVLTSSLRYLALGWCTYGVGDQMAHYSVNASVPKTLIQHLIRWVISSEQLVTFRARRECSTGCCTPRSLNYFSAR
jgi:NH3-dependent NAD+ synthetase